MSATPSTKLVKQLTQLRALMDKEDKLTAQLKPIAEQIKALREQLLQDFTDSELDSTTASGLRVTKQRSTVCNVTDNLVLNAFRSKKKNWDLIPNSVPLPAWRERNDSGVLVPGTEPFGRVAITVTRTDRKKEK
jgi:hypothetical protein